MENKLIFEACKDKIIICMTKDISLPFLNDTGAYMDLKSGFYYSLPKILVENLIFQGYVGSGVENDS